jgi:hypothetical protein
VSRHESNGSGPALGGEEPSTQPLAAQPPAGTQRTPTERQPRALVGDPVYYLPQTGDPRLAFIDGQDDQGLVCLNVLHRGVVRYEMQVAWSKDLTPGYWSWIPSDNE